MFKKIFYVLLVLALVAVAAFALWKSSGSEREMQKLRAQMYDLQKQVEKQNLARVEAEQSVKEKEEKEERKILSEALTAPSQTPPSVVRPSSAETKSAIVSVADSNDFAQSLADIQEEVKEQAMKETINDVAEAITNDNRAIDMSEVDAMIKEAEEKLVAQYGAQILEKEEKTVKPEVKEVKEEVKEEVKVVEEKNIVSTPSWQDENALPGSEPVVNIDEFTTKKLDNAPTKIDNSYISSRGEIKPPHGDAPISPSQPSWTQNAAKVPEQTVQRTTSLRPASEVIVPVAAAKEKVEQDIKAEEQRRRPPENVRRIPKKNYNALGKRTMADVMKEGL